MRFNLGHLKKIHSDDNMTVIKHPSGHEIKIMHKHLSPSMRGELESMPMHADEKSMGVPQIHAFDEGGQVELGEPEVEMKPAQAAEEQPQAPEADPQEQPAEEPTQQPEEFKLPQTGADLPKNDIFGTQAYMQSYLQGLGESKKGIELGAKGEQEQARQSAAALENQARNLQDMQAMYQGHIQQLNQERQNLIQDLTMGHVDPNQYWEDKSLPGKVSTTIGLILGGMGGGILRQGNPALQMLNNQIDRNIQAQRINMGNKFNLLNANREQFKNERDAVDMTRVMLSDNVSNQLKLAAAKTQDPLIQSRAYQAAGELDRQSAPVISQMAMRRAILSGGESGQIDPEFVIQAIVPEADRAATMKELGEAQMMHKAKDNLLGSFDQVNKINTIGGALKSPIQTAKQTAAIINPLVAGLSKETAGRFTESDAGMIRSLFPAKGDTAQTVELKRQQMNKLISEKMNFPYLKKATINPENFGRFKSSGEQGFKTMPPKIPGGP